ncbi:MAG: hypothetical protein K8H88_10180, partial [Sandaracinaceae bacterium]|nr:hypothetical protein [Sandaracinaceae bacterium]
MRALVALIGIGLAACGGGPAAPDDGGMDAGVVDSGGSGSDACVAETSDAFCARLGASCGTVDATDNCGAARSESCGSCTAPETCGGGGTEHACGCSAESDAELCARLARDCGTLAADDNCGRSRTVECGTCDPIDLCGAGGVPNVCGVCTPESEAQMCARLGAGCGTLVADDNCGMTRTVASCGDCTPPEGCGATGMPNVCGCQAETSAELCLRVGAQCGT